jgi:hypothetical protein
MGKRCRKELNTRPKPNIAHLALSATGNKMKIMEEISGIIR